MNHPATPALHRIGLIFLDLLLLVSLLLAFGAWLYNPLSVERGLLDLSIRWNLKPVLAPLLIWLARSAWCRTLNRRGQSVRGWAEQLWYKKACTAILVPLFILVAIEGVASLAGVKRLDFSPIVITGEEELDTITESRVRKEPELLWGFEPNRTWDGMKVNSLGYRTREFAEQKPPDMIRVMALGDSCTAQGRPPYSDRLHRLLQEAPPTPRPWEAFNMGVYGYSLMQGYRQFQMYGKHFDPDVVTIYFGWNDHWLYEKPDHLRMAARMNPLMAATIQAFQKKRFFSWLSHFVRQPTMAETAADHKGFRVPPPIYESTLTALIKEVRENGAIPLLITAPRRTLQPSITREGHARDPREAEVAHDQYVEITRAVGQNTGTEVLDFAADLADPQWDGFFMKDGIHLTDEGLDWIAHTLYDQLQKMTQSGAFNES